MTESVQSNANLEDEGQCFIDLEEIDSQIARLRQKKGTTIARYEGLGVDVDAVRACQKLKRKDNPSNWMLRLRRMAVVLSVIPTEVEENGQISLMPALPSKGLQEQKAAREAFWAGWQAAIDGHELSDNPHQNKPGSEEFVRWRDGWADGVDDAKAAKEANDSRKEARKAAKKEAASVNAVEAPTEVRKRGRGRPRKNPEQPTQLEKDEAAYRAKGTEAPTIN